MKRLLAMLPLLLLSCASEPGSLPVGGASGENAETTEEASFDAARARDKFVTTTDLMRYVVAPTCAAENNECHNNEDFPDMSSEGNLWNLVGLPCNQGIGERTEVEDFCEAEADDLVLGSFGARIGSITTVTDDDGEFLHYAVLLEEPLAETIVDGDFVVSRGGSLRPELGGGASAQGEAGSRELLITDPAHIADPALVRQGDENQNGSFGDGSGALVNPGDAHASYLVRRLFGAETERERMPLNSNADNPTEINDALDREAGYALMSWINCMQPDDGPYAPIRYDCAANDGNEGTW